jgi:hypothetical protein
MLDDLDHGGFYNGDVGMTTNPEPSGEKREDTSLAILSLVLFILCLSFCGVNCGVICGVKDPPPLPIGRNKNRLTNEFDFPCEVTNLIREASIRNYNRARYYLLTLPNVAFKLHQMSWGEFEIGS